MIKLRLKRNKLPKSSSQLEFELTRPYEEDRNYHLGGRSFYFFDFDDNVAFLTTPIIIFNKDNGHEKMLSSGEWARYHSTIGKPGSLFENYFIDYNDLTGSFRYFRDKQFNLFEKLTRKKQTFLEDIQNAITKEDLAWKAPSWNCFYHATFNNRPMSVITARGHNKETIIDGVNLLVKKGHLPNKPNYLSIYPVTNPDIRKELGDTELLQSVADLKRSAIRKSVETAIDKYGYSPHHRFGMSDDDPKNVELITEEMKTLKATYPDMSFFVIHTFEDSYVKTEVTIPNKRKKKSKVEKIISNNFEQLHLI